MLSLIIGGARSGKSRFAESLGSGAKSAAYIATARFEDSEMASRVERHRRERPAHWSTIEEPLDIGIAVERCAQQCDFVLLDCLTLWLSNFCFERRHSATPDESKNAAMREIAHVASVAASSLQVVLVTNELGCGLVPESELGRYFRDLQGWTNQEAARLSDWVYHVVAGIPVAIKRPGASL